jgi:hypothetical protein
LKELLTAGPHLSVSGQKEKGEEGVLGQRAAKLGHLGRRRAREKKQADGLGCLRAEKNRRKGERGREGFVSFFFKFLSNSFFKHSNSNQKKTMHSNHDAQSLIISKLF